jgi:hypothetical protein
VRVVWKWHSFCLSFYGQEGWWRTMLGSCQLTWVTGGVWREGCVEEGIGRPLSYLCIRDILCSSMSSLPRNPLAKGLFSIFNCVIWKKEGECAALHLIAARLPWVTS